MTILGISRDKVAAQKAFCVKEKLPFDLLSDADGKTVARYGAARKRMPWPQRHSILVDDQGKVRHIWRKVDVRKHGQAVIAKVKALRAAEGDGS